MADQQPGLEWLLAESLRDRRMRAHGDIPDHLDLGDIEWPPCVGDRVTEIVDMAGQRYVEGYVLDVTETHATVLKPVGRKPVGRTMRYTVETESVELARLDPPSTQPAHFNRHMHQVDNLLLAAASLPTTDRRRKLVWVGYATTLLKAGRG